MRQALLHAQSAGARGEVPVGALVVDEHDHVIACEGNRVEELKNPLAHAEMQALGKASELLGRKWLEGCTLVVTLEPCPLCAAAISLFRVKTLVFGAYDPKSGGVDHGPRMFDHASCHHKPMVLGGVLETLCAQLMSDFFAKRRTPSP